MASKKKPGPKKSRVAKPEAEAIPGDVAHGRARDAAETQAEAVEGLALAVNRGADGLQAIGTLVVALLSRPTTADGASILERLVRAAERFAKAKEREADGVAALAAAQARQAAVVEAEGARRAERNVFELTSLRLRVEADARFAAEDARRRAARADAKPTDTTAAPPATP